MPKTTSASRAITRFRSAQRLSAEDLHSAGQALESLKLLANRSTVSDFLDVVQGFMHAMPLNEAVHAVRDDLARLVADVETMRQERTEARAAEAQRLQPFLKAASDRSAVLGELAAQAQRDLRAAELGVSGESIRAEEMRRLNVPEAEIAKLVKVPDLAAERRKLDHTNAAIQAEYAAIARFRQTLDEGGLPQSVRDMVQQAV